MVQRCVRLGNFSFQENVMGLKNCISGLNRNYDQGKMSSELWVVIDLPASNQKCEPCRHEKLSDA